MFVLKMLNFAVRRKINLSFKALRASFRDMVDSKGKINREDLTWCDLTHFSDILGHFDAVLSSFEALVRQV